ncbi:MAG: SDR family oxidoreductase [Deltaproteobacteria bacterium]|nr:SDR family oxidoreductase [Deltaproteobacteria bacterium]
MKNKKNNLKKLYDSSKDGLSSELYTFEKIKGFCHEKNDTKAYGRFNGKTVLITGAKGDFGQVCSKRMAQEGANIGFLDILDTESLAIQFKKDYPDQIFHSFQVDITKEDQAIEVLKEIGKKFKRIDHLFNNAGYQGDFTNTLNYAVEDFRKIIDINVTGAFIMLKTISNIMSKQEPRGGSIVNTASMAGIGAPPNMIAYSASKAAVKHMTVIAAKDLAPFDIRVNSISPAYIGPGFMWTRQVELQAKAGSVYFSEDPEKVAYQMVDSVPMRRYGSINEVIGPVLFLLSDDASYLTGIDIKITGGE